MRLTRMNMVNSISRYSAVDKKNLLFQYDLVPRRKDRARRVNSIIRSSINIRHAGIITHASIFMIAENFV